MSFRAESEQWRKKMSDQDWDNLGLIIEDEALLMQGACCLTIYEGICTEPDYKNRVNEIMTTDRLRLEAALFLTYNNSTSSEHTPELFDSILKNCRADKSNLPELSAYLQPANRDLGDNP